MTHAISIIDNCIKKKCGRFNKIRCKMSRNETKRDTAESILGQKKWSRASRTGDDGLEF